jgi:transposase
MSSASLVAGGPAKESSKVVRKCLPLPVARKYVTKHPKTCYQAPENMLPSTRKHVTNPRGQRLQICLTCTPPTGPRSVNLYDFMASPRGQRLQICITCTPPTRKHVIKRPKTCCQAFGIRQHVNRTCCNGEKSQGYRMLPGPRKHVTKHQKT